MPGSLQIQFGNEVIDLLAERAIYWPAQRTLLLADVHLGKDASFRAAGMPVPAGKSSKDLNRIESLVRETTAERLVILGDLVHNRASHQEELTRAFTNWRANHRALDVLLIRGNHDRRAGKVPADWLVREEAEPFDAEAFVFSHEPREAEKPVLCGHVHPSVPVRDFDGSYTNLCCFVVEDRQIILPAFGTFTGGYKMDRQPGRRMYGVVGKSIVLVK